MAYWSSNPRTVDHIPGHAEVHQTMASRANLLLAILALSVTGTTAAIAGSSDAPFQVLEQGKGFSRLDAAIRAIGDGAGTILIAPGTYRQCAVQAEGSVTYKALQAG